MDAFDSLFHPSTPRTGGQREVYSKWRRALEPENGRCRVGDHRKLNARWRSKLPKNSAYVVAQVLERIVPDFERRGFAWYPDYARGDRGVAGANVIPLQRRSGPDWPTVQITFDRKARPWFAIDFTALPPVCRRRSPAGTVEIPRESAVVVEGPVYMRLCRGERRSFDCEFGYTWFRILPTRFLDREIQKATALLPELFELFDRGIPRAWLEAPIGKVADHFAVLDSWHQREARARARSGREGR